jgi:hypothetical protein
VQQCAACNTDVQLRLENDPSSSVAASTQNTTTLSSFAGWLAKHGALVRSMSLHEADLLSLQTLLEGETCTVRQHREAIVQMLCQAMQKAAATRSMQSTTATGCTATIKAAGGAGPLLQQQQQQQQQPGLRLASFSSDAGWAVGLLPALSAHSLTCLELGLNTSRSYTQCGRDAAALAAALPRLQPAACSSWCSQAASLAAACQC